MSFPQVYIGHSEPVQAVAFTPNQQQLLSVSDAIFLWDILAVSERSPPERQVPALICICQASSYTLSTHYLLLLPLQCPRFTQSPPDL